jgi:hypothetical protein
MNRDSSSVVLVICLAVLVYGLMNLLALRFESGDVYPEYSSLRSDPLGTMALFESIGKLEGFSATRDLSANRLPDPRGVTYLHIATSDRAWERVAPDTFARVDQFVKQGARLVMTMFPEASRKPVQGDKPKTNEAAPREKTVSLWQQWGLQPRVINLRLGEQEIFESVAVSNTSGLDLPDTLDWHSGLVFENVDEAWQVIYKRGNDPVVVERRFGAGSVVIATDSFFLSNEALNNARHSDVLAWVIGPNRRVVFDEAHLGIVEQPGVAALMQRYRLRWVIAAAVLLAGLFVWKNATSLVPSRPAEVAELYIEGKDSSSGFVNLLRRNVPAREILRTCYAEWKKTAAQSGSYSAVRLQKAEAAYNAENAKAANQQDPVETYRSIAAILRKSSAERMQAHRAQPSGE